MRILVVTTWFPTPSHPAVGAFVVKDAHAIAGLGHHVQVVHLAPPHQLTGEPGRTEVAGLPVLRIPMAPGRPGQVVAAGRALRGLAGHADLVHSVAISSLLPMAWWRPDQPWVHTEHWSGLAAPHTLSRPLRLARRPVARLLRRPDAVVVVSEHLAAQVRHDRPTGVHVVPNIVAAPAVLTPRREVDPLRGRARLVAVGGLVARKQPLVAIRTVAELVRRGVDAELTWVGTGPLRAEAEAEIVRCGVQGRITFTGELPPDQVGEHLDRADLFLLPTTAETFCVAAAEALAHGRPVVLGDSGGPGEFVHPPVGALVAGPDPAGFADAVQHVLAGAAGRSAEELAAGIRERYSAAAFGHRMSEVYRSVSR